jgi:cytochrome P450
MATEHIHPDPGAAPIPQGRDARCPFTPPPELEARHAQGPLTRLSYLDGHVGWLVTGYSAARTVLTDPRFSTRSDLKPSAIRAPGGITTRRQEVPPGFFGQMDPPDHTRFRRLLTREFTVRRMRELEPRIERIVADHLDAMAAAGPPADLVSSFALPIPSLVICELLGVPYADHEFFQEVTTRMIELDETPESAASAASELARYMDDQAGRKFAAPSGDILGALAAGGQVSREELANIGVLLLVAGHETTANQIALSVFTLLEHPERLAALRADPELTEDAVEELLRYLSVLHLGAPSRVALEDVELEGTRISAGEGVTLSLPAVNRDPAVFADPSELRFDREHPRQHLALGHGIHQCLGQQLARIELGIALRGLLEHFPTLALAVPADEVPLRADSPVFGLRRLPVTWQGGTP